MDPTIRSCGLLQTRTELIKDVPDVLFEHDFALFVSRWF